MNNHAKVSVVMPAYNAENGKRGYAIEIFCAYVSICEG